MDDAEDTKHALNIPGVVEASALRMGLSYPVPYVSIRWTQIKLYSLFPFSNARSIRGKRRG